MININIISTNKNINRYYKDHNSFIQKRKYTKGLNIKKSHFNFGKINKTTNVNLATLIDEKKEDKTYTFNKVKENIAPSTIVSTSESLVASNPTTPIIEKATRVVDNPSGDGSGI